MTAHQQLATGDSKFASSPKHRLVRLGRVDVERDFADVLVGARLSRDLDHGGDLFLRTVGFDAAEFGFEGHVVTNQLKVGRLRKIAIDGQLANIGRVGQRRTQFGPDGTSGVEHTDHQFVVRNLMIGMQVGRRGNEDPRRSKLSQVVGERVLQTDVTLDGLFAVKRQPASLELRQAIVGVSDVGDLIVRYAKDFKLLIRFGAADVDDRVLLLRGAIAHATVGHNQSANVDAGL